MLFVEFFYKLYAVGDTTPTSKERIYIVDTRNKRNLVINYRVFCFTHARTDQLKTKESVDGKIGDDREGNIMVCRM